MNSTDCIPAVDILRRMLLVRLTEETIAQRYSEGEMRCPTHLCSGQEAVCAAVGAALRTDDFAVSGHRAHGHYLAKGGSLRAMLAEIYGKSTGCAGGKGGSMHLVDESVGFMGSTAIVGGTIPLGVGLGLSIQLKRTDQISCVFMGDGATEEGVWYESLCFAALRKLPVLFVCENNLFSVYSPLRVRQPEGRRIHELATAIGVPGAAGDGNDAMAVYEMTTEAIREIRAGSGPRQLEFSTYRWREHCGPNFDNDLGYRSEAEYLDWLKRDPLLLHKQKLVNDNLLSDREISDIESKTRARVDDAFAFAKNSPFPSAEQAVSGVYAE